MFSSWPQSIENRAALRTAIAALMAIFVSFAFHLDTPYWSGMTVVIVSNLYTGSIIDKAMMRIIGTIAGAFLGFYAAGIVANSFLLYLLSCFLIITISVYYYNFSSYSYAYLLGGLCAFIVISQLVLNPQNAFFVAIWRPVEIGIGVLIAAISAYSIFPNHIKDNISIQLHYIFNDFIGEFNQLREYLQEGTGSFEAVSKSNLQVKKKIRKAVELAGVMRREPGITKERVEELHDLLNSLYHVARQLQYLVMISLQQNMSQLQEISIEPLFKAIQIDIEQFQFALLNPGIGTMALAIEHEIDNLEIKFDEYRRKCVEKSDFIYAFMHFINQINQEFRIIQSLIAHALVAAPLKFHFLDTEQRLRSDPDLIKHSIKAGLAVILALGFWLITKWPGGLNGIISSLIISIRKNLYDMTHISIYRFIGCILGGGIALLSLFTVEMNLYIFSLVLFFSVWGFSYAMFKFPKYSNIGLQANVALIITLAQEGGPPALLDAPLQRLGGIIIGIIASFIVANILWRSDALSVLNRHLSKLNKYLIYNMQHVLLVSGDQKLLHDLASLFWDSRELIELVGDEQLKPLKRMKLMEFNTKFESLVAIQTTMNYILATIDREKAQAIAQKIGLDLIGKEREVLSLYQHHDTSGGLVLGRRLQKFVAEIKKNPVYSEIDHADIRNFLAYINALIQLSIRVQ